MGRHSRTRRLLAKSLYWLAHWLGKIKTTQPTDRQVRNEQGEYEFVPAGNIRFNCRLSQDVLTWAFRLDPDLPWRVYR